MAAQFLPEISQPLDLTSASKSIDMDVDDESIFPSNQLGLYDMEGASLLLAEDDAANLSPMTSTPKKRKVTPTPCDSKDGMTSPRAKRMQTSANGENAASSEIGFQEEVKKASNNLRKSKRSVSELLKSGEGVSIKSPSIVGQVKSLEPTPPHSQDSGVASPSPRLTPILDEAVIHQGEIIFSPDTPYQSKPNLSWNFGEKNYKAVLGHNTVFKSSEKSATDERKPMKWRVIRLENRYKDDKGLAYVEFPARYISEMIGALLLAEEKYIQEEITDMERKNKVYEERIALRRNRVLNLQQ